MATLKIILLVAAVLAGLYLLDRVALWAEGRGWLYWRKKRASGNALGGVTLELQKIFESGKAQHVIEVKQDARKDSPDPGAGGKGRGPEGR